MKITKNAKCESAVDILAEQYKVKFTTDTKGITSLVSSIKRTKNSLHTIQTELNRSGQLSTKDRELLSDAIQLLQKLGNSAQQAKVDVKRHAAEQQKMQGRLKSEATEAVNSEFKSENIDDVVAYLSFEPISHWHSWSKLSNWREDLKSEFQFDINRHQYSSPNVLSKLTLLKHYFIQMLLEHVAYVAEASEKSVKDIIENIAADFSAQRAGILDKECELIREIKIAAVSQKLEQSNN